MAVFVSREIVRLRCSRCCGGEENGTDLLVDARRETEACSFGVLILVWLLGLEALTVVSELIGRLCTCASGGSGSLQILRGVQSMKINVEVVGNAMTAPCGIVYAGIFLVVAVPSVRACSCSCPSFSSAGSSTHKRLYDIALGEQRSEKVRRIYLSCDFPFRRKKVKRFKY